MTQNGSGADARVLAALADHSVDGMITVDREFRYVYWNRAMERIFGLSADNVLGGYMFDLFPFLVESGEDELIRRALLGETVSSKDRPFVVSGSDRSGFYDAEYAPYRDRAGAVSGMIGIVRDVTERRRTQDQLEETEERFRNMADASPVLLWMAGRDALCTFFNQTWLDFTGRTLAEEWGVGWAEGVHAEDFQRCMDTYIAAFGERRVFEMEYRLRRADGAFRWVLDRGTPRYVAGGRFAGYIGSCIDITDRKRAEADLQRAVRARDEFLSIASHELRTPLTALQLQLESLMRAAARGHEEAITSGRLHRNAAAAVAQSERMAVLVNVMLDVSRIAEGQLPLDYEEVDLSLLAHEAAARLARTAAETGSTLEILADGPQTGHWDRLRLEQLVTNLMVNAIKYGERRPIAVTVDGDDQRVRLLVRDHGIGISPQHQQRIFERFERAVSSRHYSGFGLGLWICRRIVDAFGGEITVDSAPGEGATFAVTLPRLPPEGAARAAPSSRAGAASSAKAAPARSTPDAR
jgi:PAS domain S-box-containing protein